MATTVPHESSVPTRIIGSCDLLVFIFHLGFSPLLLNFCDPLAQSGYEISQLSLVCLKRHFILAKLQVDGSVIFDPTTAQPSSLYRLLNFHIALLKMLCGMQWLLTLARWLQYPCRVR